MKIKAVADMARLPKSNLLGSEEDRFESRSVRFSRR